MFKRVFRMSGKQRLVAIGLSAVTLTALVAVLAIAFVVFGARPAFGLGSGGGGCFSTTGPACSFKSSNALAEFSSVSADGCIFTDAFVQSFESLTSPGRAATQSIFVTVSKYDNCALPYPTLIEGASNVDPSTGLPVFTGTLQFGSKLSTAAINGSAPMYDFNTGAEIFTSSFNVTWQGYGPISSFMDSSHSRSPGFMMSSHFTGSGRQSEASGVITDETGTNLATPPTLSAELNNSSGGTVQIIHY